MSAEGETEGRKAGLWRPAGVLLDDAGHVLVGDMHFEDKYLERIEVVAPDGTRYPATREKLLERSPAVILKIIEPLENWKAPEFVKQERIEEPGMVFSASLHRTGREWWISLAPPRRSLRLRGNRICTRAPRRRN